MEVIVCGSSGLLGRGLCKSLQKNKINYIGTYNSNFIENAIKINFFNINEIEFKFNDINPKVCVNCIVKRQLEVCEDDWNSIKKINVDITNNLVKVCNKLNIYLLHISADYVFDGQNAPYFPNDKVNPLQNYGISKLLAECKILNSSKYYSIIRVPVLYSDNIKNFEENAVTLIGKKILNRIENFKEDNFSIRRPNYIPDFCNFLLYIIKTKPVGIFHFCNPNDQITKYEMSNIISNYLNKENKIIPINEEPQDGAERPRDTFLKDSKYDILKYTFTPISEGLEKCFNKLYHPKLESIPEDLFFLIDLDGTLIDTDKEHYNGYKIAFENLNLTFFSYNLFINIINNEGFDNYLEKNFLNYKSDIKKIKNTYLQNLKEVNLMKNSDFLINYIEKNNINHVVVTNTSLENVNYFKEKQPVLKKLVNWITRENYLKPKPDPECFKLAKDKYYKKEKFIIGIENTINGYTSLKNITECIYIVTNLEDIQYKYFTKQDVYLINDFMSIFG